MESKYFSTSFSSMRKPLIFTWKSFRPMSAADLAKMPVFQGLNNKGEKLPENTVGRYLVRKGDTLSHPQHSHIGQGVLHLCLFLFPAILYFQNLQPHEGADVYILPLQWPLWKEDVQHWKALNSHCIASIEHIFPFHHKMSQ